MVTVPRPCRSVHGTLRLAQVAHAAEKRDTIFLEGERGVQAWLRAVVAKKRPQRTVPFPRVAVGAISGAFSPEKHSTVSAAVISHRVGESGGWPGLGQLSPCHTIPPPGVATRSSRPKATE